MPFKDKEQARRYNREYGRLRRAGQPTSGHRIEVLRETNPEQTITAKRLLRILGHLIGEVLKSKQGDAFIKARTVAYVVSVALRAVEVADLESRVTILENLKNGGKI